MGDVDGEGGFDEHAGLELAADGDAHGGAACEVGFVDFVDGCDVAVDVLEVNPDGGDVLFVCGKRVKTSSS